MKQLRKEDIKQEVFDIYDDYAHNRINKREFLKKLSAYAIGGITLPSLLSFVMPNYKENRLTQQTDPSLLTEYIVYKSPKGGGEIKAQLSKPKIANDKLPGIIVVHENRGLNPYIEDVGRRTAKAGFISIAPDALSPLGGYPGNDDEGREMQAKRDRFEMLEDFIAAYDYLKNHKDCNGNIGVVGFCFGGWISNMMAVRIPELKAAVPYYGTQPEKEEVSKIKAPLLLHFAELDQRVNEGWPEYEKALRVNQIDYRSFIYPNVNHGFHNNSTPRYDEEAAVLSWKRTIEFFRNKLK